METTIITARLKLLQSFRDALDAIDEASMDVDDLGRMREGGKVNLDQLGDDVWLEQFR